MASVIEDAAKEVTQTLILDTIKEWYSLINNYKDNINELKNKYDYLLNLSGVIKRRVKLEEENQQKSTSLTDAWLEKVKRLMEEDEELQELMNEESRKDKDQCCLGHLHCNWRQRYKMSKLAASKAKEIEDTINGRPQESMITEPKPRSDLQPIPSEYLDSLSTREKLMKEILEKLRDDKVNAIGVTGMGAIGKTTLVKEIANKFKGSKDMFDEVVMVEISEVPNVERIQREIAEQLGLHLEKESISQRAIDLYNRLKEVKPKKGRHADDYKRSKKLIILDNIWDKLNLGKVGIPTFHENTEEFCCKFLVTSRERKACQVMGVSRDNTFEVCRLNEDEARKLFTEKIGDIFYNGNGGRDQEEVKKQEQLEKRVLSKCGGVPLAIVAVADVLRGQELSVWEHYANELEKPISIQDTISGVHGPLYAILQASYNFIKNEDKKRFLLLACLFSLGSPIRIEDVMRYGIGLDLFQRADSLTQVIEQANTWAQELKLSALLLEDDNKEGRVKIHDAVRASIISLAQKGGDMIMVEALPKWLSEETCQKYYAISLMSGSDHSRLNGLHSDKLQILILDGSQPGDQFPDTFFEGMLNLKVLVLKGMDFTIGLPKSIGKLKPSLRTLVLEDCKLGEIGSGIGELTNLVVLSFRGSRIMEAEFPAEAMRNLGKLCLLDLTKCEIRNKGIPADVLSRLLNLEGLYLFDSIEVWANNKEQEGDDTTEGVRVSSSEKNTKEEFASINELNKIRKLKVVELEVPNLKQLPEKGEKFVSNLDRFMISINTTDIEVDEISEAFYDLSKYGLSIRSRTLVVCEVDDVRAMEKKYSCVKALLNKCDRLFLQDCAGLELEQQEGVKELCIFKSEDSVECFTWTAFPNLEMLALAEIPNLKGIKSPPSFSKLRCLLLENLTQLQPYVLPVYHLPPNLTLFNVRDCPKLNFLFGKDREINVPHYSLPCLQKLQLEDLTILESMLGDPNSKYSNDLSFFNPQLLLPSLQEVDFDALDKIVTLWDVRCKETSYISSFQNLTKMRIWSCGKLETLGSFSVAAGALVQLKSLRIWSCPKITQVIINDQELAINKVANPLPFPSLETLELCNCPNLQSFLSSGNQTCPVLQFPSLQSLSINQCDNLHFSPGTIKAPKLSQVEVDYLETPMQEIGDINQFLQWPYRRTK